MAGEELNQDDLDEQQEEESQEASRTKKKGTSTEKKILQYVAGGGIGIFGSSFVLLIAIVVGVTVGVSLLNPSDSFGNPTDNCNTPGQCAVNGDIVSTAKIYAWPESGHGPNESDAKNAYVSAEQKYNPETADQPYSDCGVFVATVMRASGVDPNYAGRGVSVQWAYVTSHPNLYHTFSFSNTSQLQAGDILYDSSHADHTMIFAANQGYPGNNVLSASLNGHVPEAEVWAPGAAGWPAMTSAARYIGPK